MWLHYKSLLSCLQSPTVILRREICQGFGSFSRINPQLLYLICHKALASSCGEVSLLTLVDISWRDPYVTKGFCSWNYIGRKRNSFSQPWRKYLLLIGMEKTLLLPIYLPKVSGFWFIWPAVTISMYSKFLHTYIFRRKISRQVSWKLSNQACIWKEMQRSLLLLKLTIKKSVGSLSFDNIGIGHLSQKVKLVPSLELFQYNRRVIKNLL